MASSIIDRGDGTGRRTLRVTLESDSSGVVSFTTTTIVNGKVYSWKVIPYLDSYQPTTGFAVTIKDGDNLSVVRSPTALNSIANTGPIEATVLDANGLTGPYVISEQRITFAGSGLGNGKKVIVELNVLE